MLTLASIYVWIEMLTSPNIYVVLFTGYMARPKSAAPRGHGSRYLSPIYYVGVQSGSTDCGSDLLHFLRAVGSGGVGGGGGVGGVGGVGAGVGVVVVVGGGGGGDGGGGGNDDERCW